MKKINRNIVNINSKNVMKNVKGINMSIRSGGLLTDI